MAKAESKATSDDFVVVDIDADHVTATAFNMLFVVWRFHTGHAAFRRAVYWARTLTETFLEGIGVQHILEPTALAPDAPTRRVFVELLQLPGIAHYSIVYTGAGFRAASIRAVVVGAYALARPQFPHTVHADLTRAATWHAVEQRRIGHSEGQAMIERVSEGVRSLHRSRYPAG